MNEILRGGYQWMFLFIANGVLLFGAMYLFDLRLNISDSYPIGIYKRTDESPQRHSLVESCLPERVAALIIERAYAPDNGICGGYPPVIKTIVAVTGDEVLVNSDVSVNGVTLKNSIVRNSDGKGRKLVRSSSEKIEQGNVWLMSTYSKDSFDARYFGQTSGSLIVSTLRPLWTIDT